MINTTVSFRLTNQKGKTHRIMHYNRQFANYGFSRSPFLYLSARQEKGFKIGECAIFEGRAYQIKDIACKNGIYQMLLV